MTEPMQFLDAISGYVRSGSGGSADRPIRLAKIDPAYDAFVSPYPVGIPLPKVTFEGESTLSGKAYPVASGYIPIANARVWMVPIGNTYMVAGAATQYTAQGFYGDPAGLTSGVEFGEGSYFDTDAGLSLTTDADIAGDLDVGGFIDFGSRGTNGRVPEMQFGSATCVGPGTGTAITITVTFPVPWAVGTAVFVMTQQTGSANVSASTSLRVNTLSVTNFTATVLKTDAARINFDATTSVPFQWVAFARPATP
jgi:hypothetical protein